MTSTKQTGPRIFPNIYTHVLTESLKRRCWSYCSVFSRRQFLCTILRSLPKTKPFWWPENWKKRPSQALRQILNLNSPPARTWIALAFKRNSGGLAGLNAGTELLFLLLQKINMNYMNIYMYIYIYTYISQHSTNTWGILPDVTKYCGISTQPYAIRKEFWNHQQNPIAACSKVPMLK